MESEPRDIIIERLENKLRDTKNLEERVVALEEAFFEMSSIINGLLKNLNTQKDILQDLVNRDYHENIDSSPVLKSPEIAEEPVMPKNSEYIIAESGCKTEGVNACPVTKGDIIIASDRSSRRTQERLISRANEDIIIVQR
ncbi:MAG: hypothetical protein SVJ22_07545 [Halobacteriota archaeon]|nr:hypothetical protein [Halobacteriota archaeon]